MCSSEAVALAAAGLALGGVDVAVADAVAVQAIRPVPLRRFRAALGINVGWWKLRLNTRQRERAFGSRRRAREWEAKTYHGQLRHRGGCRGGVFACGR